jgi:hypothetical protein
MLAIDYACCRMVPGLHGLTGSLVPCCFIALSTNLTLTRHVADCFVSVTLFILLHSREREKLYATYFLRDSCQSHASRAPEFISLFRNLISN